jgi:hypothetical protein
MSGAFLESFAFVVELGDALEHEFVLLSGEKSSHDVTQLFQFGGHALLVDVQIEGAVIGRVEGWVASGVAWLIVDLHGGSVGPRNVRGVLGGDGHGSKSFSDLEVDRRGDECSWTRRSSFIYSRE